MPGPTDQYRQHHAVDVPKVDADSFRPFWRVRTRLDQLLLDRAITVPEWRAAIMLRTLAEIVLSASWRSTPLDRNEPSGIATGIAVARRLDAIDRLQQIQAALGGWAFGLLESHVVNDQTWVDIGARLNVHPKTARNWTILALKALAALERGAR